MQQSDCNRKYICMYLYKRVASNICMCVTFAKCIPLPSRIKYAPDQMITNYLISGGIEWPLAFLVKCYEHNYYN